MSDVQSTDLVIAKKSEDGFWRGDSGKALHVSASDLERHAYCPLSWALSREGKGGRGKAIDAGREKHAQIHKSIENFKQKQINMEKSILLRK